VLLLSYKHHVQQSSRDEFESKVCLTNKDSILFTAAAASLNAALLICVQESAQELACNITLEHGIKTVL
jgi:hypothetical protein